MAPHAKVMGLSQWQGTQQTGSERSHWRIMLRVICAIWEGGKWSARGGGGGGGGGANPLKEGGGGWQRGSGDRPIAEPSFGVPFYPNLGPRDGRGYVAILPTCGPPRVRGLCSLNRN